jgi:hypothetical protein
MYEYLKAAFLFRARMPGLGDIPFNVFAVIGFLILGFGHPGFWLLGLGLEAAFLLALATNTRFQRLVDARRASLDEENARATEQTVAERLDERGRARLGALEAKYEKILDGYRDARAHQFVLDTNRDALRKLVSSYAELLLARQRLEALGSDPTIEERLKRDIAALEAELGAHTTRPSIREAKSATLRTLQRRVENLSRRQQSLQEIDTYLAQIEAQVELAFESGVASGRPEAISADIDVASFLLNQNLSGEMEGISGGDADVEGPTGRTADRRPAERQ